MCCQLFYTHCAIMLGGWPATDPVLHAWPWQTEQIHGDHPCQQVGSHHPQILLSD